MDLNYAVEEEPPPPDTKKKPKLTKAEKKLKKMQAAKMALCDKMRVRGFRSI